MSNILLIYLGSRGGGVYDTYAICEALCKVGKNQYSLIISENNPLKEDYKKLPLKELYVVKTHNRSIKDFLIRSIFPIRILKILKIIKNLKPSLIFITMFHPWVSIITFYAKIFLSKTPIVFIRHNPANFESVGTNIYNKILNLMEDWVTYKADYIFTLSETVKEGLIKKYKLSQERVSNFILGAHGNICKNFVHKGFFKNNVLRLTFFGRILYYKGVDILINAYEILKREELPVELTIAGEGYIEGHLLDKINNLGVKLFNYWISEEEMGNILAETDVVVLPYKRASQSGPASIALALGLPVIATRVGGLQEQVRDGVNGFLIEPNSVEALIDAVKRILQEPYLLNKFSDGAKSLRDSEFSWTVIGRKMDEKFTEILKGIKEQ